MTCEICGKTAMRIGTKGRGYCLTHASNAWAQANRESTVISGKNNADYEDARLALKSEIYFTGRNRTPRTGTKRALRIIGTQG